MSKRLQFSALECVVTKDLPSLLRHEWSMGNGQCPECYGHPPDWFGHPLFLTPEKIGHKPDCVMAAALEQLGAEHRLREGEFKSDLEYEVYWPNCFMSTRVKHPDNPPDPISEELRRKWDKIWVDSFMELGKGLEAVSDGSED